jgi:protein-L-isoaspartate(D-aspartate) O-methyltransferase
MAGPDALLRELSPRIADRRVLDAIRSVPRDRFVPESLRSRAWDNEALPIGHGQTISQPLVVARMAELLELDGTERVLDVGTGSGYHAAVLAELAAEVTSIERHAPLARTAALALAGQQNVEVLVGDGTLGHPDRAPYDAINVAASADEIPPALLEQLADGGRLVLPLEGILVRIVRRGEHLDSSAHDPVRFVPLV